MPYFIIITFHRAPFHYLSATSTRRYFKIEWSIEMCENDYLYYDNHANLHTCICQAWNHVIACKLRGWVRSVDLGRLRETDQYGS